MPRSFEVGRLGGAIGAGGAAALRDPRLVVRVILGGLLAAIVAAALLVFRPWGGSEEDLQREAARLQASVLQRRVALERLRALNAKIETGRKAGSEFQATHFLERRTAFSTLETELARLGEQAGIRWRDRSFNLEPVDGSETLSLMTITANLEGTYADLVQFVNLLDRSRYLLIVDSLRAAPQQGDQTLAVSMKIHAFVRESSGAASEPAALAAAVAPGGEGQP